MASRVRLGQQWGGSHEFLITRVEAASRGGARSSGPFGRLLHSCRRHWKNCVVAIITVAALLWFLTVTRGGPRPDNGRQEGIVGWQSANDCPVPHPRMSIKEIQEGLLPYLYGGVPEDCEHCSSDDYMPRFCRFGLDGHGQCWGGRREALVQTYLARGFTDILTFTPCDLLPLLRGRTLFFAGDSQTQDFMMAAHCFMHVFTDLGWREMDEAGRTDGPRKPGFVWHTAPGCVLLPGDARICFLRCDDAQCMLGEVMQRLSRVGRRQDYWVVNFGLHYSPSYREELEQLVGEVQRLRREGEFPQLVWKDTPPQHFETEFGEYPEEQPKPPMECAPLGKAYKPVPGADKWRLRPDHSLEVLFQEYADIGAGGWRNKIANEVMRQAGVPVVDAWNETLPLWDYHRDNGAGLECTHFCVPSAPQLWLFMLYETLRREQGQPAAAPT